MTEDMRAQYRTRAQITRPGPLGALARFGAAHPALLGLIGGVSAVGVALARGWRGASAAPEIAAVLCAIVILVWVVLVRLMRGFFEGLTRAEIEVIRVLEVQDDTVRWSQGAEALRHIEGARWSLCATPTPTQKTSPAWLIAAGEGGRLIVETRLDHAEAARYSAPDTSVLEHVDEALPPHILSPLLDRARDALLAEVQS